MRIPPHLPYRPAPGLSRADADSPSKFAEALLGREFASKSLQQFLQHGGEVLRFYMLGQSAEGVKCVCLMKWGAEWGEGAIRSWRWLALA